MQISIRAALAAAALLCLTLSARAAENCFDALGCYGAIAIGTKANADGTVTPIAKVVHNYPSQDAAYASIIESCRAEGYVCQIIARFSNGGCGYIAIANGSPLAFGIGSSADAARASCASKGRMCGRPVGACTQRPRALKAASR